MMNLSDKQKNEWVSAIEPLVVYNRACLFVAHKLRSYQNSGVSIASGSLRVLFILLITTITLAVINLALYTFDPSAFEVTSRPTFFTFFFYSVNNFAFNFIKEVTPASAIAQAIWMLGFLFALLLITILVSLILTERARRQDDEMKAAIAEIEAEGAAMEAFIVANYRVQSIGDVIEELERVK